jgi:hypothetical protein
MTLSSCELSRQANMRSGNCVSKSGMAANKVQVYKRVDQLLQSVICQQCFECLISDASIYVLVASGCTHTALLKSTSLCLDAMRTSASQNICYVPQRLL